MDKISNYNDPSLTPDQGFGTYEARQQLAAPKDNRDIFSLEFVKSVWPPELVSPLRRAFTPETMYLVLNELSRTGVLWRSCVKCCISPAQVNRMKNGNTVIGELVEMAYSFYRERVAEAIHDRAVEGWDEPVFYQGEEVGKIRKYSDRLLELQAKRHIPEYRDRSTTDINIGGKVLVVHATSVSREEYLAERRKADAIDGEVVSG